MNLPLFIISVHQLNPSLFSLKTSKPPGFSFIPGHSCLLHIPGMEQSKARAFTFISTNANPHLEFLIKLSPDNTSITHQLIKAQPGDALAMTGLFGTHRATTPGTFIASGIGVAPFLAIARSHPELTKQSTLFWSLKQAQDIIYEQELTQTFKDLVITLTQEHHPTYKHGRITAEMLKVLPLHNVQTCGSYEFNREMKQLILHIQKELL